MLLWHFQTHKGKRLPPSSSGGVLFEMNTELCALRPLCCAPLSPAAMRVCVEACNPSLLVTSVHKCSTGSFKFQSSSLCASCYLGLATLVWALQLLGNGTRSAGIRWHFQSHIVQAWSVSGCSGKRFHVSEITWGSCAQASGDTWIVCARKKREVTAKMLQQKKVRREVLQGSSRTPRHDKVTGFPVCDG